LLLLDSQDRNAIDGAISAFGAAVFLSGAAVLPVVGQNERAVEESMEGVSLRPDFPLAYAQALDTNYMPYLDVVVFPCIRAERYGDDGDGISEKVFWHVVKEYAGRWASLASLPMISAAPVPVSATAPVANWSRFSSTWGSLGLDYGAVYRVQAETETGGQQLPGT